MTPPITAAMFTASRRSSDLSLARAGQLPVQFDRGDSLSAAGKGDNFGGHAAFALRRCGSTHVTRESRA